MDSIDGLFDPAYTCPLIESTHEKCNADGSDAAQWFEALETYKNSIRSHAHDPSWCVPPSQAFSLYPEYSTSLLPQTLKSAVPS